MKTSLNRLSVALQFSARKRRIRLHSNSKEHQQPVFIVGSGRSGNTLLRRGLVEHTEIHIPPETYEVGRIIRFYLKHNNIGWSNFTRYGLGTLYLHKEYNETMGHNLAPLQDSLDKTPTEHQTLYNFFNEFYKFEQNITNPKAKRWGDKTPVNTLSIYYIEKVFPDAKFLWIIRNPIDVVSSYLKSKIYQCHKEATSRWIRSNQIMTQFQRDFANKVSVIHYEDLVSNFDNSIANLSNFCGLDYKPERTILNLGDVETRKHHANVNRSVTPSSIGKGLKELSPATIDYIKRETHETYTELL